MQATAIIETNKHSHFTFPIYADFYSSCCEYDTFVKYHGFFLYPAYASAGWPVNRISMYTCIYAFFVSSITELCKHAVYLWITMVNTVFFLSELQSFVLLYSRNVTERRNAAQACSLLINSCY